MKKSSSFLSFVHKEFLHILRDRRTMLILLVMPVILIILFGYAVTTEVRNSRLAILDESRDEVTTDIREQLAANRYFTLVADLRDDACIDSVFLTGKADLVVVLDKHFSASMQHGGDAAIQILADGSEPNQASVRTSYAQQIIVRSLQSAAEKKGISLSDGLTPTVRMLYNPQGKSEYNFVPAVIGVILMLICAMMTSIAIVKEKESGTMEILLASPLPAHYIVLAKLVPYFVISCVNLTTILLLSTFLLGIPVAGSLVGFIGITLLYIVVALSLGLFISTVVSTQLAAMLLSLLLIVPSLYLSGMAFPLESMPEPLQRVSAIVPVRWYIEVARKLMIQGVALRHVVHETLILSVMAIVLMTVSWKMFKTRL